jgi:hypothetical protein
MNFTLSANTYTGLFIARAQMPTVSEPIYTICDVKRRCVYLVQNAARFNDTFGAEQNKVDTWHYISNGCVKNNSACNAGFGQLMTELRAGAVRSRLAHIHRQSFTSTRRGEQR